MEICAGSIMVVRAGTNELHDWEFGLSGSPTRVNRSPYALLVREEGGFAGVEDQ